MGVQFHPHGSFTQILDRYSEAVILQLYCNLLHLEPELPAHAHATMYQQQATRALSP